MAAAYRQGTLVDAALEAASESASLLPVVVAANPAQTRERVHQAKPVASGAIRIELPGRAAITVESGADMKLLRAILEGLRS